LKSTLPFSFFCFFIVRQVPSFGPGTQNGMSVAFFPSLPDSYSALPLSLAKNNELLTSTFFYSGFHFQILTSPPLRDSPLIFPVRRWHLSSLGFGAEPFQAGCSPTLPSPHSPPTPCPMKSLSLFLPDRQYMRAIVFFAPSLISSIPDRSMEKVTMTLFFLLHGESRADVQKASLFFSLFLPPFFIARLYLPSVASEEAVEIPAILFLAEQNGGRTGALSPFPFFRVLRPHRALDVEDRALPFSLKPEEETPLTAFFFPFFFPPLLTSPFYPSIVIRVATVSLSSDLRRVIPFFLWFFSLSPPLDQDATTLLVQAAMAAFFLLPFRTLLSMRGL